KTLFVDLLMNREAEAEFVDLFRAEWLAALDRWTQQPSIVLFDEVNLVLTRAVCRWMGISLAEKGDRAMARELVSMIENAGSVGPGVILALLRRRRTERFVRGIIEALRGQGAGQAASPIAQIANFRDSDGERL